MRVSTCTAGRLWIVAAGQFAGAGGRPSVVQSVRQLSASLHFSDSQPQCLTIKHINQTKPK